MACRAEAQALVEKGWAQGVLRFTAAGQTFLLIADASTKNLWCAAAASLAGIAVVLAAVFLPMAFFGGSVGVIYRQFSITIVSAMFLSVAVAIVFTPALCATILKTHKGAARGPRPSRFNEFFSRLTTSYSRHVESWLKHPWLCLGLYAAITAGMIHLFQILPTAFIPREDQGRLIVSYELPRGSTRAQTEEVVKRIERYFMEEEKDTVARMSMALGFSFAGEGQSIGQGFLALKDWSEREGKGQDAASIARRANAVLSKYKEAKVIVTQPGAIPGLGTSAGFDFRLEDRSGVGYKVLTEACQKLLDEGLIEKMPLHRYISAVSVGVVDGVAMADLCYEEDSAAEVDMNIIMTDEGNFVEVQGTGENGTFTQEQLLDYLDPRGKCTPGTERRKRAR